LLVRNLQTGVSPKFGRISALDGFQKKKKNQEVENNSIQKQVAIPFLFSIKTSQLIDSNQSISCFCILLWHGRGKGFLEMEWKIPSLNSLC
jgi:hypothetical protein